MSEYLHRCGVHRGLGRGGFSRAIWSQRGFVWASSALCKSASVTSLEVSVSVTVVVAIVDLEDVNCLVMVYATYSGTLRAISTIQNVGGRSNITSDAVNPYLCWRRRWQSPA